MDNLIQLKELQIPVLNRLLMDKTTGKNIIWATDSYSDRGKGYQRDQQMLFEQVIKSGFLQPRILKSLDVQKERTKKNAEVYTPAWICNLMNNQIDQDWFDDKKGFNQQEDKNWIVNADHISFLNQDKKTWEEYVSRKVLEITCGEAPFLVSRYDSSTGNPIAIQDRVGLFDRKLRVVTENTNNFEDWYKWALKALKSTYGYEFQGDSLLIGRVNVYLTLLENAKEIWNQDLTVKQQEQIADIICWNLFQMDGLTDCIPVGVPVDQFVQPTLFDSFDMEQSSDEGISLPAIVNCWDAKIRIREMKEGRRMSKEKHWGVIIGNPPYQESDGGYSSSSLPVYNKFFEAAKSLDPDKIDMIMPARWYCGGRGLDDFRKTMLEDKRIQEVVDFENYRDVFPNLGGLAGGACYILWNKDKQTHRTKIVNSNGKRGEDITLDRNLNEFPVLVRNNKSYPIVKKVFEQHKGRFMDEVVSASKPFGLRTFYKPKDAGIPCQFVQKIGLKFADPKDVTDNLELLDKWKFLAPRSPIAGQTDFTKPVGFYYDKNTHIAAPGTCCTESFIVLYASDNREEVESFKTYLFTKTVRFLLLQSVVSQDVTREKFRFVPALNSYSGVYTDKRLQEMWNLTNEEMEYIDTKIHNYADK